MKYIVISANANQEDIREFNDLPAAIGLAQDLWAHLTAAEKKTNTVYVLESVNPDEEAMDHFDGNTVFDASSITPDAEDITREWLLEHDLDEAIEEGKWLAEELLANECITREVWVGAMDDGIRETLHFNWLDGTEEEFLAAYCYFHQLAFGEKFAL